MVQHENSVADVSRQDLLELGLGPPEDKGPNGASPNERKHEKKRVPLGWRQYWGGTFLMQFVVNSAIRVD